MEGGGGGDNGGRGDEPSREKTNTEVGSVSGSSQASRIRIRQ
jgi:hypothetical protein